MADHQEPLLNLHKTGILVLLAIAFHLFATLILTAFVPTPSVFWQWLWACFAAIPLTGAFFLAASMFTMVLVDQLRRKRGQSNFS